jgi:hypothetical protein
MNTLEFHISRQQVADKSGHEIWTAVSTMTREDGTVEVFESDSMEVHDKGINSAQLLLQEITSIALYNFSKLFSLKKP